MSYSLPHFPVSLLKQVNPQQKLKTLQVEISQTKSLMNALRGQMVNQIYQISLLSANENLTEIQGKHLEEIKAKLAPGFYQKTLAHLSTLQQKQACKLPEEMALSNKNLISLNMKVKTSLEELSRLKMQKAHLSDKAVLMEDILESVSHYKTRGSGLSSFSDSSGKSVYKKLRIKYNLKVWPYLARALGILSAILSLLLIFIEVLGLCNKQIDEFLKEIISKRDNLVISSLSLLIFGYAILCVHFAVFRFKFTGFYNLYYGQQTDAPSLLYSGL